MTVPASVPVPLALIVDSDRDSRRLHAIALESVAADVEQAEDGADALAHALVRPPQLVVTELRLPRIDGIALCAMLRNEPATRDATILVVTASALPIQIGRARQAGADDVLVKPVDPIEVRERVRQLVQQSRALRATSASASARVAADIQRSTDLLARVEQARRRVMSRSYARQRTTTPPIPPPVLRCPDCDRALVYDHSNVGGVSEKYPEQWDYFICSSCGMFQYRHRTRRTTRLCSA